MKWSSAFRALRNELADRRKPARHARPAVEPLEDRSLPSVLSLVPSTNPGGSTPPPGVTITPPPTTPPTTPPPANGNTTMIVLAVAPAAGNDWIDTDGTTPVTVNVLANDTPSAGAVLLPGTVTLVGSPQHGSASVNAANGQITYRAGSGFVGTDTFLYTVRDSLGGTSNPAMVSVRVNRPVAADDWIDTDGTTPVNVAVLANDTDPDGNQHIDPTAGTGAFVTRISNPLHGTAVLNADGSFTYTALAGFTGTDSFRYTVTDDNGGTSLPATVYVRVNVPTAGDDLASFSGTTPTVIDVLANDTDPDGNSHLVPSSVTVVTPPQHGTVTPGPVVGQLTYTANAGFNGTDTFRYTVSDDNGATSAPARVTVVGSVAVGANPDFTDTDGTTPVAITVLANDSAPGAAALVARSVVVTTGPKHGKVTVNPVTGDITYTAAANFVGTDTFQYRVGYGTGVIVTPPHVVGGQLIGKTVTLARGAKGGILAPATVSVRVNRPVAADDWIDTDGTTPVNVAVLANDTDPDGNQHIDPTAGTGAFVTLLSKPLHGKAVLNADGTFTYTAVPGFTGTDSFRYTVTDDNGGTSLPATVYVRVNVPTAADDFGQAAGTAPVVIDVLANDTDPDGNQHLVPSSVTIVAPPQHGSVSVDPTTGKVTYTAFGGWSGTDSFRYTVSDDNGATSSPALVLVNTALPIAAGGLGITGAQKPISFAVLASAGDPLGSSALVNAVVTVTAQPQNGHVTVNPTTHAITYIPNAGFTGLDSFSYTVTDANGAQSLPAVLTVRVLPAAPASLLSIQEAGYVSQYIASLVGSNKHPVSLSS
jgi:hypothetical protein